MDAHEQQTHVEESVLEQYVLGKLPTSAAAAVSEHLFQCDGCFQQYEMEVDLRAALRNVSAEVLATESTREAAPWWHMFRMPAFPAFAAAAAALVVLFAFLPMLRHA